MYSGVLAGETYSMQVDAGFADLDRAQDQLRCELYWGAWLSGFSDFVLIAG